MEGLPEPPGSIARGRWAAKPILRSLVARRKGDSPRGLPMTHRIRFVTPLVLAGILSAQCTPTASPTNLLATSTPTIVTFTSSPHPRAAPSPTPNPDLPCGTHSPEGTFAFLDCSDIRRIRGSLGAIPMANHNFAILKRVVDDYSFQFPTSYNPDESWDVLWWGSGNYMGRDMALLYLTTGDLDYARDVVRLLNLVRDNTPHCAHLCGYGAPRPNDLSFSGGLMSHPRYGGVVHQSLLFAYLSVRDTALFTEAQRADFDQFFIHQALLLEEAAQQDGSATPITSWINRNVPAGETMAALTIAASFPDSPEMQSLEARVRPRLDWQLANWWEADGGWGENVEGYGFRVLEEALLLAETLRRTSSDDLYSKQFGANSLHSMCHFYVDILTPEGTTPALNDTPHHFIDPGLFTLCAARTNDQEIYFAAHSYWWGRGHAFGKDSRDWETPFHSLAWIGLRDLDPSPPARTAVLLPHTGAAILRSDWTHDAQYALLQFTASKVHNEYSFGAVYLFDHGPWLVGNGYHTSGAPTDQHSTLGVDRTNQSSTGGESASFGKLETVGIAGVRGAPYPNLRHTRTLTWMEAPHLWLVIDDISGTTDLHSLQLRWYVRGSVLSSDEGIWSFGRPGRVDRLWIVMTSTLPASYSSLERHYDWESWANDANGVEMVTTYPGRPVRLVTLLAPSGLSSSAPDLVRYDFADGSFLAVTSAEESWYWLIPSRTSQIARIEDYEVLGSAACAATSYDPLSHFCLLNGTSLRYKELPVVQASAPIYLEANRHEHWITVEAPCDVGLEIYWPEAVSHISDAHVSIPFDQSDSRVLIALKSGRHTLTLAPRSAGPPLP